MKRATFSILFYVKKTKTLKNGEIPMFVRITVNGKNCEFSLHRSIKPTLWDSKTGKASGRTKEAQAVNEYLEHFKFKIYEYRKELEHENKIVTAIALRNKYTGVSDDSRYLLPVFMEHNEQCRELIGRDFASGTVERYECCYRHLQKFIEKNYKRNDVLLSEIDHKFIKDFEFYLKTKSSGECSHNTATKYIKNFKKIILYALANDWIRVNPFRNIKFHIEDVDVPFLDTNELEALGSKEFQNERIQKVKDIFVFCCFTGLAYSDVKNLEPKHLIIKDDGELWLMKNREKTGNPCHIPVLPPAKKIIDKYENDVHCIIKNRLLPVPSNQKMNSYLKEIADFCGIDKELTTHTARHTFATTVTLANNISIEVVSKMLGHSSVNMTKRYARVVDDLIKINMEKIKVKYSIP